VSRVAQLGKLLAVKEVRTYIDMWLKALRSVFSSVFLLVKQSAYLSMLVQLMALM
jgi:hypothetical protein